MRNKKTLWISAYFFLLNVLVMCNYTEIWGFSGIEQLVTAHDAEIGSFSEFLFLLNMSIALIFIYTSINITGFLFSLSEYIVSRSSSLKFLAVTVSSVAKAIIVLAGIKLIIDLMFCIKMFPSQYQWLFFIFFSYVVTFLIWGFLIILLSLLHISKSAIYFISITSVLLLQIFSSTSRFVALFIVASENYKEDFLFLIAGKIMLIILLLLLLYKANNKYEVYGEVDI